jgi:hypothetical protein
MPIQLNLAVMHEFACRDALYEIISNSGFRDKWEMKFEYGMLINCIFSRLYPYIIATARQGSLESLHSAWA